MSKKYEFLPLLKELFLDVDVGRLHEDLEILLATLVVQIILNDSIDDIEQENIYFFNFPAPAWSGEELKLQ